MTMSRTSQRDFARRMRIAGSSLTLASATLLGALVAALDARVLGAIALLLIIPLFIVTGPTRLVVWVMGAGSLVAPTIWPLLASVGKTDIYVGDVLLVLSTTTALAHQKARRRHKIALIATFFMVFGLLRSGPAGAISFIRIMEPIIGGIALGSFLPAKYDLWRDVRWMCLIIIATGPLFGPLSQRWTGLSGGSNETALIAAVTVILGVTQRHPAMRFVLVGAGLTGLAGARGIAATIALFAGLATFSVVARHRRASLQRIRRISPILACSIGLPALFVLPLLRPDLMVTLKVHAAQAELFGDAFRKVNPLIGAGWSDADQATFSYTVLKDLHDVYLDVIVYLGIPGILLFAALVLVALRSADPLTRAILITVLTWLNTVGAFPGAGWGVLGLTIAVAVSRSGYEAEPRSRAATSSHRSREIANALGSAGSGSGAATSRLASGS